MRSHILLTMLGVVFLLLPGGASGYEVPTHDEITRAAGKQSSLDEVLRSRLGVSGGLDTILRGRGLTEWLAQGLQSVQSSIGIARIGTFVAVVTETLEHKSISESSEVMTKLTANSCIALCISKNAFNISSARTMKRFP